MSGWFGYRYAVPEEIAKSTEKDLKNSGYHVITEKVLKEYVIIRTDCYEDGFTECVKDYKQGLGTEVSGMSMISYTSNIDDDYIRDTIENVYGGQASNILFAVDDIDDEE